MLSLIGLGLCMLFGSSQSFVLSAGRHTVSTIARRTTSTGTMASSTSTAAEDGVRVVEGIRDVVDRYDTFLLDMWGVMHDGTTTYEGVLDVVQKLKEQGKDMIILSNSSKRQDNAIKMLTKLGFDPVADFSQIITSGEVSYQLLSGSTSSPLTPPQPWNTLEKILPDPEKRRVFCFGSGDGDEEYVESCGWKLAPMEEADLIVSRGTFTIKDGGSTMVHKTQDGEEAYFKAYHEQLQLAVSRKIPMLVANPDKIRPDADRSPMPGTIGGDYQKALLHAAAAAEEEAPNLSEILKYIGKPFPDVYEIAMRGKDPARVCMVGDALETDVTGGSAAGIDTLWIINDGIHNVEVESAQVDGSLADGCAAVLENFNGRGSSTYAQGRSISPTVVLPHFRW